jgi:hypothetical protein
LDTAQSLRRNLVEFWIGLSVGMQLGKVIADYLEKFFQANGILDPATVEKAKEKIERREKIGAIVDRIVD